MPGIAGGEIMPDQGRYEYRRTNERQKEFTQRVKRYMAKGASEEKASNVARRNMKGRWR